MQIVGKYICNTHIQQKACIQNIDIFKCLQINKEKSENPIENEAEHLNKHSAEKGYPNGQ